MNKPPPSMDPMPRRARRLDLERILARVRQIVLGFLYEWRDRPRYAMPPLMSRTGMMSFAVMLGLIALAAAVDGTMTRAMRGLSPHIYAVFRLVTDFGESGYMFFLTALIAIVAIALAETKLSGRYRTGLYVLAGRAFFLFCVLMASGVAAQVFKRIGRARPRFFEEGGAFQFDPLSLSAKWASMPSGHTVSAFAIAVGLGYFLPKWRDLLLLIAALIGVSRIVLGAHFVSDVVVGAAIGMASAYLLQRLFAVRAIVFTPDDGRIAVRGRGLILPALRHLMQR